MEESSNGLLKVIAAVLGVVSTTLTILEKLGALKWAGASVLTSTNLLTFASLCLVVYFVFDVASWTDYFWGAVVPGVVAALLTLYWCLLYRTINKAPKGPKLWDALVAPYEVSYVIAFLLGCWLIYEIVDNTDNDKPMGHAYTDSAASKAAASLFMLVVLMLVFFG